MSELAGAWWPLVMVAVVVGVVLALAHWALIARSPTLGSEKLTASRLEMCRALIQEIQALEDQLTHAGAQSKAALREQLERKREALAAQGPEADCVVESEAIEGEVAASVARAKPV